MPKYISTQFEELIETGAKYHQNYIDAEPFPNISFKNFFNNKALDDILDEFPDLKSKKEALKMQNPYEKKFASEGEVLFKKKTKLFLQYLNSEPFLLFLSHLTGIKNLIPDPYFHGGGLHEIKRNGLLKIHADFNKHQLLKLDRRINVLIYLNKDWSESYGGHFELWNKSMTRCEKKILPEFNTMAIFSTTSDSYHGHPDPLRCPENRSRKSLALYYYTSGRPDSEKRKNHSTLFQGREGVFENTWFHQLKRFLIRVHFHLLHRMKK